ncbi:uncharacterized protein N7483_009051 [Penicillium malachiteum]|uniref:uncharacterized protein n=1 Tax=Penicillium malachiteum TaxID=1324776 RepID=UPI002548BFBF|nr:uncharacterized protein N7483_009051 [Penicillium malachiteum]KAJ5721117.1 hypothetical protein N7483_009051 [Penicillium malachiteum]
MPSPPLQPPSHPIALRRSHLLSPAPDRLTATPTTLRIIRENTISGRDFSVHQLRSHEEISSPRRSALLFTVSGRFWSNSQLREIRDAGGRPLLELRRIWWKGQWSVRRPGSGQDLLQAEMRWGIGMKMMVRFENALLLGPWDEEEVQVRNRRNTLPTLHPHMNANATRGRNTRRRAADQESIRTLPRYENYDGSPPPYSFVMAADDADDADHAHQSSSGSGSGSGGGSSDDSDNESLSGKAATRDIPLPSYESVRRMRRVSSHSLRDLLDAIEPPSEPAPASSSSLSSSRPRSEGGLDPKVELKVVQHSSTTAGVMMDGKRIIHIRREKVMDFSPSGPVPIPKWEVEVAEGVDLLLATSIVLIMAEFVKNDSRMRSN